MKTKSKKTNKNKKGRKKVLDIVINIVLVLVLLGIVLGISFIIYIAVSAPTFNPNNLYKQESSIVYDKNNEVIGKLGSEIRDTITYDQMPEILVDAIIATEDSRFFMHNGVDLPRFIKASVSQLLGKGGGGASTITMQLSKQAYTGNVATGIKGIIRKFTDIYLSVFKIERKYTKEQILEYYVNFPGLGSNSFGVAEASQTYFGKDVSELNLSEAALLAGLFQAPTAYNPYVHPDAAEERRATVLRLMKRHGYITEEEEEMANSISVESLLVGKQYTNPYQNFIDVVIDEVVEKTGESPYTTPMKIYTTLDKEKQDHLNSIINGEKYTWVNDKVQVGIAVTDVETGGIVALSGGRNTVALGFNRATDLNNQPGSTAKPIFDYAPGVEYYNWSTYTPFIDEPHSYSNGVQIKNWDSSFKGLLTLKESLGLSRNIPALKAFQNVPNAYVKKFVTSLGINPEIENGIVHEAHALGAFNGTSPLEMAAAYAAFANGGYYIEPYTITKIVYTGTNQTKEFKPSKTKVMSDSTAYIITNSLIWSVNSGLASGERIYGREIAAKTGTTNFDTSTQAAYGIPYSSIKDYWVVGYTPKISMALWYGYDKIQDGYNTLADNSRKDKVWNLAMSGMVSDSPKNFTIPKSVVAVEVEKGTIPAMLPSENTPKDQITTEYFKSGTEPTMTSPRYMKLDNVQNLNVTLDNGKATLTWDAAKIPEYYTEDFMNTYITDTMGDTKENYIEYRQEELEKLGDFGYDIYISTSSGEKLMTRTNDTTVSLDVGKYVDEVKFIVRTSWENDKTTSSTGSEYTISNKEVSLISVELKGDSVIELNIGDTYTEQGVIMLENLIDVTNKGYVEISITNSKNEIVSLIDTSYKDTFKVKYTAVYKNTLYVKTRTVIVK
jgi:penicillin-binding protein 1A